METRQERVKRYAAKYRATHKARTAASDSAYQKANRERINARTRALRAALPPGLRAAMRRAAYAANPQVVAAQKLQRRSLEARAAVTFDPELDALVFAEAVDLCARRSGSWSIDHVVPLKHREASGLHTAMNIQVAPLAWNCRKSNRSMETYFPIKPTGL